MPNSAKTATRINPVQVKENIPTKINSRRFSFLDAYWTVCDEKPSGTVSLRIDVPKLETPFWISLHVFMLGQTLLKRIVELY